VKIQDLAGEDLRCSFLFTKSNLSRSFFNSFVVFVRSLPSRSFLLCSKRTSWSCSGTHCLMIMYPESRLYGTGQPTNTSSTLESELTSSHSQGKWKTSRVSGDRCFLWTLIYVGRLSSLALGFFPLFKMASICSSE